MRKCLDDVYTVLRERVVPVKTNCGEPTQPHNAFPGQIFTNRQGDGRVHDVGAEFLSSDEREVNQTSRSSLLVYPFLRGVVYVRERGKLPHSGVERFSEGGVMVYVLTCSYPLSLRYAASGIILLSCR